MSESVIPLLGMKRKCEQAAITLPRRAGKTVAQTIVAALVAVTQPDGNTCCCQLGSRQSKNWLALTISIMRLFRGSKFAWKLEAINNKESITITNCCGTKVTVSSYPGPRDADASNYRGVGDKLMLLLYDEFYFFKEVVYTTTLPLAKNGAAILMISSMSKSHDDAVRRMIHAKLDEEEDLFIHLDWLRACPDCVAKGVANACDHIEQRPQHFEPRGALNRMRKLIAPFGQENFERELLNTAARSNREPLFSADMLGPLRDRACDYISPVANEYPEFFLGVDPADKGFSRTAILGLVFDTLNPPTGVSERCLLVTAEVLPKVSITTEELGDWVVRHALAIRRTIPSLRNARAVICIENNSILVAQSVTRAITRNPQAMNMGCMMENEKGRQGPGMAGIDVRAGTRTTHESKERIVAKLRELLWEGALCFHRNFFIPHPEKQPPGENLVSVGQHLLVNELANMCAEYCQPKGPVAGQKPGHVKYKGYNSDGTRATDDKVMALGFCLICYTLYKRSPHLFMRALPLGGR